EVDAGERELVASGVAVDPATLRPVFDATLASILGEATLSVPAPGWVQRGGRTGRHTEHLGHMLAEMQSLQRSYPGATW
ncbi:MAG: phenylacetate-CoA oxygenase subunit PaaI, partial [Methylobacteriaceae bacterium]|nr:phenylacetate-CoA oxygenase subunit PaaI [Methylobacteriaceae bacterium]